MSTLNAPPESNDNVTFRNDSTNMYENSYRSKDQRSEADAELLKIFGELYEKTKMRGKDFANSKLLSKLSNIKFMRQIELETDPYNLASLCDKILY